MTDHKEWSPVDMVFCEPFKCKLTLRSCQAVQRAALSAWRKAQSNKASKRLPKTGILVKLAACSNCKYRVEDGFPVEEIRAAVIEGHEQAIEYIHARIDVDDISCDEHGVYTPAFAGKPIEQLTWVLDSYDRPLDDVLEKRYTVDNILQEDKDDDD